MTKGTVARAWQRLTRRGSRDRGFVEAGVAAAGAVLVVGALVGNGVASTVMDMSDGQTWLPDEDGRIVQINPATGQPERRLLVGGPGSELDVAQRDGHLVVTDIATGGVTSIDLASVIASGTRGLDGEDTKVLLGGGLVVIVDLSPGTVRAVDPLTLADLGRPYRTDDLADAVIDDEGQVWLITTDGQLRSLSFTARGGTWSVGTDRPVTGAGAQSRLVPHPVGATVLAPDGGVVLQVGNGADVAVSVAALEGSVEPAPRSPADLVPAAVPQAGRVVMLAGREALTVAVSEIGCARPGAPQVFRDLVYVPCRGDGRVVVLDRTGARAAEDIIVPGGGDPELVVDDGRLIVRTPDDGRIVIVQSDGTTSTVDISAADVPVQDANRATPVRPAAPVVAAPADDGPAPPTPPAGPQPPQPPAGEENTPGQDPSTTTPPARTPGVPAGTPTDRPSDATEQPSATGGPSQRPTDPGDDVTDGDPDATDEPSDAASDEPGDRPTGVPGDGPTGEPDPSDTPTDGPSVPPTDGPSTPPTDGPSTPPTDGPSTPPTDGPPTGGPTAPPTDGPSSPPTDGPPTDGPPTDGPSAPPTDEPTDPADRVPGNVNAQLQANGEVHVTWAQPVEPAQRFVVAASDGSTPVTVAGTQASATLSGLTCGRELTVRVEAQYASGEPGVGTDRVTTVDCAQPTPEPVDPAPSAVLPQLQGNGNVSVVWTAPQEQPASYVVAASDGTAVTAGGSATSAILSGLTCERTLTITVTAHHGDGRQGAATAQVTTADCPRDPAPSGVTAQLQGDGDVQVSWTAPQDAPSSYTVAASGGTSVTAGGGATTATLSDLACERTLTITVTAHHGGGVEGSATASVTTADCPPPEPDPATAAGSVSATALSDGTVRVTWTGASSGADRYLVRPVGGSATTASASDREIVISGLTPGGSYRFEVETQLGTTTAVSTASNQVTVADVPGTVSGLSASMVDRTDSQVRVAVSFSAAPENGSPVTGYRLTYSGGGVSGSTEVSGTSTTLTISCSGQTLCSSGGSLTVSVNALSAVGSGSAVDTTVNVPAPPPPPPANGDSVLGAVFHGEPNVQDAEIPMYVMVTGHASWSGYDGTCRMNVSGAITSSWNFSCGASGQLYVGAITQFQTISVSVTAVEAGVTSASSSGEAPARNQWAHCPPVGECTEPVSLPGNPEAEIVPAPWTPPEDPGEPPVVVVRAPWTPPEVPNPPVLLAGLLMVGAAGAVRQLRRTLATTTLTASPATSPAIPPPTSSHFAADSWTPSGPAAASSPFPADSWTVSSADTENRNDTV